MSVSRCSTALSVHRLPTIFKARPDGPACRAAYRARAAPAFIARTGAEKHSEPTAATQYVPCRARCASGPRSANDAIECGLFFVGPGRNLCPVVFQKWLECLFRGVLNVRT